MDNVASGRPWHLWLVGLLSLLWNGFGAYDYIMSQTRNLDYMRALTEPFGADAETAVAYFDSFPIWADILWAVGVWGAVLGSLLLLARSRFAVHAFLAGLAGLIATLGFQFANPLPGLTNSTMSIVMSGVVSAALLLLAWYARRMTARGVLR